MTADKPSHEYSIMGHDLKRKLVIRIGIKFEPYTHFIERTLILNFVIQDIQNRNILIFIRITV